MTPVIKCKISCCPMETQFRSENGDPLCIDHGGKESSFWKEREIEIKNGKKETKICSVPHCGCPTVLVNFNDGDPLCYTHGGVSLATIKKASSRSEESFQSVMQRLLIEAANREDNNLFYHVTQLSKRAKISLKPIE